MRGIYLGGEDGFASLEGGSDDPWEPTGDIELRKHVTSVTEAR